MKSSLDLGAWIDTLALRQIPPNIPAITSGADGDEIHQIRLGTAFIRYRTAGNGPKTIVFAADPPVVVEQYNELIAHLKSDFRVIVFELPGFGFSFPLPGFKFDFKSLNDVVAEFLTTLGFGPYVLAFPCVAAYCSIDLVARYPSLVDRITLIQAPSWSEEIQWKRRRDPMRVLSMPVIGQLILKLVRQRRSVRWLDAAVGSRPRLNSFVDTTSRAFSCGACFSLASIFQNYLTDSSPILPRVKGQSLIIWGDADSSHALTDKTSTRLYCEQHHIIRMPHAGHFPELEEPLLFARVLKAWLL